MSGAADLSEDEIQAYVDDALAPERRLELERTFMVDPEAARRVASLRAQRSALRDALAPIAAEPIPPALDLSRILALRRSASAGTPWSSRLRLASAAVVILCIGGVAGWVLRAASAPPFGGLTSFADEASNMYAVYAPDPLHPVEIKADDKTALLRWIADRLHRQVIAPDLSASGYRLMGGRVVPTPQGPAGMFMYDDGRGTRICIFLRPTPSAAPALMTPHDIGRTKGFSWSSQGMGYGLVGPDDAPDLHPLANEARRQIDRDI